MKLVSRRGWFRQFAGSALAMSIPLPNWQRWKEVAELGLREASSGLLNAHQWGFFYAKVFGSPAPGPEAIGLGNGMAALTIQQWREAVVAAVK